MKAPAQSPMRRPAFLTLILFPLSMIRWLLQGIVVSKPYRNLILRLVRRSGGPLPTTHWPPSSPSVVQMLLLRSDEHTSELQSLMRISYAVFCSKTKTQHNDTHLY